jgi:phosphate transport system substrate-binding protein
MFTRLPRRPGALFSLLLLFGLAACGSPASPPAAIVIDGSSTVHPISEAVAAEYRKTNAEQPITVGLSSTGVGLRRFCAGEIDIADASRHMTADEIAACAGAGVEFVEMPVAYDAICVIVNRSNTWARSMTVADLKTIWAPAAEGRVTRWRQVRKNWPDEEIHLSGPDAESDMFDFFNEMINGGAKKSRTDYTGHVDDNGIIDAVERDEFALGYVGFIYYAREAERLAAVAVDDLDQLIAPGAIEPALDEISRGMYRPLSRPLFVYVNAASLDRPEMGRFVSYYARFAPEIVERIGGVPLNRFEAELAQSRAAARMLGTMFANPEEHDMSLHMRLSRHQQGR